MARITLADGWKRLHTKGTVILASAFAAVTAFGPMIIDAWNFLPSDMKDALPEGTARWVSTIAFLLILVVRYTAMRPDVEKDDGAA